jgi:hypothetical protein
MICINGNGTSYFNDQISPVESNTWEKPRVPKQKEKFKKTFPSKLPIAEKTKEK